MGTANPRLPRRLGRVLRRAAAVLTAAAVAAGLAASAQPAEAAPTGGVTATDLWVDSGAGADAVRLDTTVYVPASATRRTPASAILLAHGFGGTKASLTGRALDLAGRGFVVLTYTARGMGQSTGTISIDAPQYEVADASRMLDVLADMPEVLLDGPGDPRVGVHGGSYGGGLSLLLAGHDPRVDAVVAVNTWNSLVSALAPNSAGPPEADTLAAGAGVDDDGVWKQAWAEHFWQAGFPPAPPGEQLDPTCGRFRPEYCRAYLATAQTGRLTEQLRTLLAASSPATVAGDITAPTLLVQGEGDLVFGLSEADATARAIAAAGTPVKVVWHSGGHGAGQPPAQQLDTSLLPAWFDFYLRGRGPNPGTSFDYATDATGVATVAGYPGLGPAAAATQRTGLPLTGGTQPVLNPAGGTPAAVSTPLPGDLGRGRPSGAYDIPGQTAVFDSAPLGEQLDIAGSPVAQLQVSSPSGEAVLFAKLYALDPAGQATLLGQAAPLRLTTSTTAAAGAVLQPVTLPALVATVPAGHRLRLAVASTDAGYAGPTTPATYQVGLAGDLQLPTGLTADPVQPPDAGLPDPGRFSCAQVTPLWVRRWRWWWWCAPGRPHPGPTPRVAPPTDQRQHDAARRDEPRGESDDRSTPMADRRDRAA